MKLSHSKLSTILTCPMSYYLAYKQCITPVAPKTAFSIGTAVHWGLEHNTEDLIPYFVENEGYKENDSMSREQILSIAMTHGYLTHKEEIFKKILYDEKSHSELQIIDEIHEIYLNGKLKSYSQKTPHDFVGIIDLLLLTDKGFILIDYKTSSFIPNWNDYLDQIYRYIFLLQSNFPDVPIYKIGIINLRKSGSRQKRGETEVAFLNRLKFEYELNDEDFINYHMFEVEDLDKNIVNAYIDNLSRQADTAELIDTNNMWYINYDAANGKYKSQYWDIFYKTPSCHVLYNIKDTIFDEETKTMKDIRRCKPLDMLVIEKTNILNKYEQFRAQALAFYSINNDMNKDKLFEHLKKSFIVDDELLEEYWLTLLHEIESENV